MKVTKKMASRVLEVIDAGLVRGLGSPAPGDMCVEAAVCYALGEPHGDAPTCVERCVRGAKIRLNDSPWSSNEARANGLRKVAIAQLGSAGSIDVGEFVRYYAKQTIRRVVPVALRAAASMATSHRHKLEEAARRCENDGDRAAANSAYAAANSAYAAAAYNSANAVANAAAANAAATNSAPAAAHHAAPAAANAAAAYAAAKDEILTLGAEVLLDALKHAGSPGCKFLYLAGGR